MSITVAYTQPYVPKYRVPLFEALSTQLAARGMGLEVYSAQPRGEQAIRNDAATGAWHRPLSVTAVDLGRWVLEARRAPAEVRRADVLVSELAALNGIAWSRSFTRRPLILWGHGKPYVNDGGWLSDRIEWELARRAAHVMTYAPSGRKFLIEQGGLPSDRVTAVGNSTDTLSLRGALNDVRETGDFVSPFGASKVVLFVGALDSTKRLDFVLEAFGAASMLDSEIALVVAGEGAMARDVDIAAEGLRILRVGDLRGRELARAAAGAHAIWMPGRVGLVAVDALALGLPIHTTEYRYHAPEIEFLRKGEIEFLPGDPVGFASASLALMRGPRPQMRDDIPTVESVATNMASVIERVLES